MNRPSNRVLALVLAVVVVLAVGSAVLLGRDAEPGATEPVAREPGLSSGTSGPADAPAGGTADQPPTGAPDGAGSAGAPAESSTPGSSEQPSGPVAVPPADPAVPAERELYCSIDVAQIRNLLAPGAGESDPASALRDAVPLLRDRLVEWRSGAEGLTGTEGDLALVQSVLDRWEEALAAFDDGDTAVADASLSRADAHLQDLESSLGQDGVAGCP